MDTQQGEAELPDPWLPAPEVPRAPSARGEVRLRKARARRGSATVRCAADGNHEVLPEARP